jgi:dephospho-CoA kinase
MNFSKMVAITGCIGCGKTYISNIFEELGIPVFNTDACAQRIINSDSRIIKELKQKLGDDIYFNGVLNKQKLGANFFKNEDLMEFVESLVHPAVFKEFFDWKFEKIYKEKVPFVMMESAILTKHKTHKLFDYVVLVDAPIELRKERIMKRPGMTKEKMNSIFQTQDTYVQTRDKLISSGTEVIKIFNDESSDVKEKVKNAFEYLKERI